MPETDAITPASQSVRAASGLNGHLSLQDRKITESPVAASSSRQDVAEPRSQERACTEGVPAQDAHARSEAAASAVGLAGAVTPRTGELELKLLVDIDRLADFNDATVIATSARSKGTRRNLKTVYYDTPERTLWRNGLTLRVRQSGARFVQAVKAEFGDDPLRRGEWEASVPSIAPDIALAMSFIPAKLHADLERCEIEAVFTAETRRHRRILDLPSGAIEVAFDQGLLKSGDRSVPVSEIELEVKSGSPCAIYELALRLAEHGPLRPSVRSKAARGFDLADEAPPAARKPPKIRLDPSIALDDAFAAILRSCFRHLLESLPAAEDGRDPEGIHQLRVSLRRLRAALDLMRSVGPLSKLELLRSEAKWLARNLSDARDWDIFQNQTLPTIAKGCPSIAGFDALGEDAEKRRSSAYRNVRQVLAERRCACFVIGLGGWIEARLWRSDVTPDGLGKLAEPANGFARRMLSEQYAKVLKRGRHFKSLTAEQRHRLRLAVKRLRYVADFLLPLYGQRKSARRFSRGLADLQEELGCYNDMATTASLLAGLGRESSNIDTAAAAIGGWQAHAMIGAETRLRNAWSSFVKTKTPWSREVEE